MKSLAWAGLGILVVGTAMAQTPNDFRPVSTSSGPPSISEATLKSLAQIARRA